MILFCVSGFSATYCKMLRNIILVFLLITRFTSYGKSIDVISPNIENSLNLLASTCENTFLKEQIVKKALECPANLQPHLKDHLRCLLFYDISKQLCEATNGNKLELNKQQIEDFNKPVSVDSVCTFALKWNISNLLEYPNYKPRVEKILGSITSCALLCTDDLESLNAKYSCKYYNWGLSVLNANSQISTDVKKDATEASVVTLNSTNVMKNIPNVNSVISNSEKQNQDMDQTQTVYSKPVEFNNQLKQEQTTVQVSIAPANKPDAHIIPTKKEEQQTGPGKSIVPVIEPDDSAVERPNIEIKKSPHITSVRLEPNSDLEVAKEIGVGQKEKIVDPEDYQNLELDAIPMKEDLGDTQGEDDGDGDPMPDVDSKITLNNNKAIKKLETSIAALQNDVISNREYVSNTFPEAFNTGDDHFFPIFLSSVIMLVLLYVLYHNKSKVSKVVLGLIIEGRQSGRRRNSRGHAYRRLDTLEQAMSANSSAPPSKIIY